MSKLTAFVAILAFTHTVSAQTMPAEYDGVLKTLGKQGDFKANVLKECFEGQHTEE
jgi:hypothetical protein